MRVPVIHMFAHSTQLLKLACCLAYAIYSVAADDREGNETTLTNTIRAEEYFPDTHLTSGIDWNNETEITTSNEEIDLKIGDEFRATELDEVEFNELMTRIPQTIALQEKSEDDTMKEAPSNWNQSNAMNASDDCLELLSEFVSLVDEHKAILIDVNESDYIGLEIYNLTINSMSNLTGIKTFISNVIENRMLLIAPYNELDEILREMGEACSPTSVQNFAEKLRVKIELLRDIVMEVNVQMNLQIGLDVQINFNFSCSLVFDVKNCNDNIDYVIDQLKVITKGYGSIAFHAGIHNIVGTIMFGFGFVGNFMLLIVFLKQKEMRTLPNSMILNMTIADFLMLLINSLGILKYYGAWKIEWCAIKAFVSYFIFYANTYSIVVMNVQRSVAIFISYSCTGTRFSFTKCHFVFIIVSVWIFSGILAIYPTLKAEITITGCNIGDANDDSFFTKYFVVILIFSFIIPLIAIVVSACVTTRVLKKSVQHFSSDISGLEEIKRTRVLGSNVVIALTVVFALTYGVYNTCIFITLLDVIPTKYHFILIILTYLRYVNACLNPLAVFVASKKFRRHIKMYFFFLRCRRINKLV
ncbi:uncharacterized protein [Periplaneta americana]|uniref:uncharacterized protein isoform X1 n=1 Tax=Periplaneta americana TaxID=6978 RepID=UPI0037E91D34